MMHRTTGQSYAEFLQMPIHVQEAFKEADNRYRYVEGEDSFDKEVRLAKRLAYRAGVYKRNEDIVSMLEGYLEEAKSAYTGEVGMHVVLTLKEILEKVKK